MKYTLSPYEIGHRASNILDALDQLRENYPDQFSESEEGISNFIELMREVTNNAIAIDERVTPMLTISMKWIPWNSEALRRIVTTLLTEADCRHSGAFIYVKSGQRTQSASNTLRKTLDALGIGNYRVSRFNGDILVWIVGERDDEEKT